VTDGTAAALGKTSTSDLSHYYSLKKKNDSRVKGGVSYDSFLAMKQRGDFEDFSLLEDKQMKTLFLQ
jgi:hypothetical protein